MNYTIDKLINKAENKYFLAEIIAQRAKFLKNTGEETIGYEAINSAIEDFCNDQLEIRTEERDLD